MGDGMGGMALAIFAVMALMLVGGFVLFLVIGRLVVKAAGARPGRAWAIALALGVAGLGAGALLIVAVFREDIWSPRPRVHLRPAAGSDPAWIVLLEDPRAAATLDWRGIEIPFRGLSTEVAVPASGVLRVRDLGPAGAGDTVGVWPDGATSMGGAVGPAPPGLGATAFAGWTRRQWSGAADDDLPMDAAFAAWVRAREGAPAGVAPAPAGPCPCFCFWPVSADAAAAVLRLLAARAGDATICPSEAARALATARGAAADWRAEMPAVHAAVDALVTAGRVRLSWRGRAMASRAGAYRIGRDADGSER